MISSQLLKAVSDEQKVQSKEREVNVEKQFVVDNWEFFAEDKGAVKGALFQHPKDGTELVQMLGLQNVVIRKIKKEVLVSALVKMDGSDVFKLFMKDVQDFREVTTFFVLGKRALVMSNSRVLKVPGKFTHKLESSGTLPDIYYIWADELKGKERFY